MGRPRSTRTCVEPGCDNKHMARGYCSTHYRHGAPEVRNLCACGKVASAGRTMCGTCKANAHQQKVEGRGPLCPCGDRCYAKQRRCQRCKARAHRIKNVYRTTEAIVEQVFVTQGSACAICAKSLTLLDRDTNLDHCHADGQFRGVLCAQCNKGLGSFRDSPALLEAAIKYLSRAALAKAS